MTFRRTRALVPHLPIGTKVKLSTEGLLWFEMQIRTTFSKDTRGRVIGYGRFTDNVRVVIDSQVTPNTYPARFWERAGYTRPKKRLYADG